MAIFSGPRQNGRCCSGLAAIFVSLALSTGASGEVMPFLDNFEDGSATDHSPATWVLRNPDDPLDRAGVVNGDLVLTAHGFNDGSTWVQETVGSTGDVSVRAQIRFLSEINSAGVFARGDAGSYFAGINGEGFLFVGSDPDPGNEFFLSPQTSLRPLEQDVDVRIDVEDLGRSSRVSLTAWETGTLMPIRPQLSFVDNSPRRSGVVGLFLDPLSAPGSAAVREFEVTPGPPLVGDYNGNGTVEQADLDLVLLNWGHELLDPNAVGWSSGRPSGAIDQEELDRVLLNWGMGAQALAAASVPEPASAVIAILVLVAGSACQWRRFE